MHGSNVNCVEVDGWTPLHIGSYLNTLSC